MKKNIVIIILIAIIIFLLIKIMNPSVVTQRKISTTDNNINSEIQDKIPTSVNEGINDEISDEAPMIPEFRIQEESQNTYSLSEKSESSKLREGTIITRHTTNKINEPYDQTSTITEQNKNSEQYQCADCDMNNYSYQNNRNTPLKKYDTKQVGYKEQDNNNSSSLNLNKKLSVCAPYKETSTSEYMGMNIRYTIEILGWQNGKCILNFESDFAGSGSSFEDTYGIPAESAQIFGFAPKVRCEFTKQQLLYVGDSILEENNPNRKMLKDPNQISFPNMNDLSVNDVKLLQVIFNDRACNVVNSDDLTKIFEGLFNF